jgi:hypothetical protein
MEMCDLRISILHAGVSRLCVCHVVVGGREAPMSGHSLVSGRVWQLGWGQVVGPTAWPGGGGKRERVRISMRCSRE